MWSNNIPSPSSSSANAASPPPHPLESVVLGKRKANDTTQHDSERFAKRFNLLSLEANALQHSHSNSNYYLPVSNATTIQNAASPPDPMSLDDSRHRVYVSNLDSELASIAASEAALENAQKLIFLPDIERHFNQMPREMLRLQNNHSPGGLDATAKTPREQEQAQELVLYTLPRTLTQEGEGANETRKAILEARQRAREKALLEAREREMSVMYSSSSSSATPGGGSGSGGTDMEEMEMRVETAHGYGPEGYEEWRDAEEADQDDDGKDDDDDDDVMDMD